MKREPRTSIEMDTTLSDGTFAYEGSVHNISRTGFMATIPERFDFHAQKCVAVVAGRGKNFRIFIKPRWSRAEGTTKNVGFKIISPTFDWIRFLYELEGRKVAKF